MKKSVLFMALFFTFQANATQVTDFYGAQLQFKQPISFSLGKYAEDAKATVQKGEVQYLANYDAVIKAKEDENSPFCTLSISKTISYKSEDYAQASSEIIEQLHQKKTISIDANEVLIIKDATLSHAVIKFKIESKKENRILAECITPGAKEEDDDQKRLIENLLDVLVNNQGKLKKKGRDFPPKKLEKGKKP